MTDQAVWREPSFPLDLLPKQVDVWCAPLDVAPEVLAKLYASLSPDERARADRFHFARHRSRFVVSRGALREILGTYLHISPESVRLSQGENHKPCLEMDPDLTPQLPVLFNASHSESLAVFAFSREAELGVDIEYLERDMDYQAIYERQFTKAEKAHLDALPDNARRPAFFRVWTRKEACLKVTGDGLRKALDSFAVPLEAGYGRPISLTLNPLREATLYPFVPARDYEGALVATGSGHKLRWLGWKPASKK